MQLFSRQAVLAGPAAEVSQWAADIREYASELVDTEIALWSAAFGAPVGSMAWAMRVEGLAQIAANTATFMADDGYHERLAAGREFLVAPAQDQLMQPIHGALGSDSPPVGSMATITEATMAASYEDVITWSVELSELVEGIVDTQVLFGTSQFGTFGGVTWIVVAEDAAAADAMTGKLAASGDYLSKLSSSPGLFVPGSGHRSLMTRVA
jgi:hypothetical protein